MHALRPLLPFSAATVRLRPAVLLVTFALFVSGCDVLTGTDPAPLQERANTSPEGAAALATAALPGLPPGCEAGVVPATGALYLVCAPENWNGGFVLYAHGYVQEDAPLALPSESAELAALTTTAGFGFATTSYRVNGLAIRPGLADVLDLAGLVEQRFAPPGPVLLAGASEGGLITTLAAEQHPDVFDGALPVCGPNGDFQKQINHLGDFRVVFDYFFPGVLPGTAVDVPPELAAQWETRYVPAVLAALAADPDATRQLLRVTRAAVDPDDPSTVGQTAVSVLWYSAFATANAIRVLGGQPFDNQRRLYVGSDNDFRLNRRVQRFRADAAAKAEITAHYQTTGALEIPLVSLHTTGDPVVPVWHQLLYRLKAYASGSFAEHTAAPILRYGHCNFEDAELLAALSVLLGKTGFPVSLAADEALAYADERTAYRSVRRDIETAPSRTDLYPDDLVVPE